MISLQRRKNALVGVVIRVVSLVAVASFAMTTVVFAEGAQSEPIVRSQSGNAACVPKRTVQGAHVVVAFTTTGACDWSVPAGVTTIDYAVVAGGGGGASRAGGGGGAGGFLSATNRSVSGISTLTISVGAGGGGGAVGQRAGLDGSASTVTGTGFTTISATGGGGGGNALYAGRTGGSGGGAGGASTVGSSNSVGTGTAGQGSGGGAGRSANCAGSTTKWCAGGGGGANAAGGAAALNGAAGSGGAGKSVAWLTATTATALSVGHQSGGSVFFAGGGGGGADHGGIAGAGGVGGGGAGSVSDNASGFDARPNTGGGGGGSGYNGNTTPGDAGGGDGATGVVVIRYSLAPTTCTGTTSYAENSYVVVAFTAVQSNCTWTVPAGVSSIDYLVVGGGGGGGYRHGGGGGAGGLLTATNAAVTAGSALTITVGAGGTGGAAADGSGLTSGGNSVVSQLGQTIAQAIGGGAQNATGGSGGGAAADATLQTPGNGTAGQGNAGGYGANDNACTGGLTKWCGGGGGGAGAVGQNADASNNNKAGNGGAGLTTSLFSVTAAQFMGVGHVSGGAVYFAGGGGGGVDSGGVAGTGGLGGGANGSANQAVAPTAAQATTGGGGGGGSYSSAGNSGGGNGGSGVVVIRYTPSATGSVVDSYANLDGVSQHFYVAEGTAFDSRAVYSAEIWAYPTTTTCASMCPLVSHDGDYTFGIANNKITAFIYHSGTGNYNTWNTKITIRANEWQHISLVRDGAAARFYVNGQLRESYTLGGATRSTYNDTYPLWLGKHYTNMFTGRLDHFRFWSTARTESDIASGMHQHTPTTTTGLIAQYDFNNVTSTSVSNTAPSAASDTALTAANGPTYRDVKSTSYVAGDVVVTFPRSYLTSAGGWTVPDGVSSANAIVVAGGGGGGSSFDNVAAGGGGAGGLIDRFSSNAVQFTASTVKITVGTGGFGGGPNGSGVSRGEWQVNGNDGQNSVLDSLIAVGGGAGGARLANGRPGGSGGGAGGRVASSTAGTATSGQGNTGGKATVDYANGGGGGGAGTAGGNSNLTTVGAGGGGVSLSITGASVTYAEGGVGGTKGSNVTTATSGAVNTGSGGAGGNGVGTGTVGGYGGDGGSGVVVVRYTASSAACSPTETRVGVYVVVKFDVVGNCNWNVPAGVTALDYLVVAGGGGGGAWQDRTSPSNGGGGGAGGVLDGSSLAVTPTQPLSISVGAGGAGGVLTTEGTTGANGSSGTDSSLSGAGLSSITAVGGGYGGGLNTTYAGGSGGSGGGSLGSATTLAAGGAGTSGPPRQGYDGGSNNTSCGGERPAGGGGGAGAVGGTASCTNDQSGAGGAGRAVSITGSSVVYAGGGGGGGMGVANAGATPGAGGSGGGGAGGGIIGANGVDGLGGGGGGAGYSTSVSVTVSGGDGGDGVVIVRYVDRIITKVEGDSQTGNANSSASVNPKVRVVDAAGNGIDGVAVSFATGANSGTIGTTSATTSGGGYASTTWTFGTGSSQTIDATMSALTGSNTATFSATVTTTYSLSYDANGGSGAPVQASVNVGSTATVSSTVPTRTGYTFSSWNTAANGSGTQYAASATFTMPNSAVTLYAQWTINSLNIIYDANGGTGAPATASSNYGTTVTISSTRPTRTGYTFSGWNTAANGSGTSYSWNGTAFSPTSFTVPNNDVTMYAQWTINSYTVTYDANGGSGAPTSQSADYNTSITVSSTTPTRSGYTFSGWNTAANGSGTSAASSSSYTVTSSVTLYAQWSINSYNVSYDANGGSGAPPTSSANYGSTVTISSTRPTRTGYTFSGWNTAANGSGTTYSWNGSAFSPASFTLSTAVTLYAQWTINSYTVTYNANGGTGAPSSQTTDYNTSITVSSTTPTRSGYTFSGWNTAANGSGNDYSASSSLLVTANVTLYAKWVVNTYSISYDANGGSGAPVTASGIQFGASTTVSSTTPTRSGYTFSGWNTAANGSGTSYASSAAVTMPATNISLYAQWTATIQTVTYNANGGTGAPSTASVATAATATVSSSLPTRTGYTFLRWNTAANGSGTDYSSGATFTMGVSNVTLYAVWLANTYSVTYDANGGAAPPASSSAQTDATFTVSASLPTRAGYTLVSWNTARNGGGTHYLSSATFTMPANAVTLYAQWAANANNIAYNANGGTGAPANSVATTDSSTTLSSTVPTRSGYTFTGWNTVANGSGTSYASGATFTMPTTHLSLFAQWTPTSYQVIYNANGGTGAPTSSSGSYLSNITLSSVAPTYIGYTFLGWGTLANGAGTNYAAGGSFPVPAQNTTLYAVWVADTNDVYYVMNGGNGGPSATVATTNQSVSFTTTVPTRTGYSFTGWNTAANGSGTSYSWNGSAFSPTGFTMPGSDIFFYAQWSVNSYSLSYDVNGGTGSTPTTQTATYLSSVTVATPSLTRAGWSFVGWNTAANGTGTQFAPGGSLTFGAAGVTLYAEWTRNVNAVIFDAVGGASAPAVRFGATGTSVTLPNEVPLREGYTFLNWEDSTQTTHNPGATLTMPASSMTLFARWSINSYLLTYDANGGTGSLPTTQSVQFSSGVTVSAASVTRSSFTFAGWNTAQDGSGTSYDINASFTMPARPVTLFAQWTPVVTTTTTTTTTLPATVVVQKPTTRPSVTTTTSTTSTTSTTTTTVPEIDEPVVVDDADQQTSNTLWVFVMSGVVLLGAALVLARKLKRKL